MQNIGPLSEPDHRVVVVYCDKREKHTKENFSRFCTFIELRIFLKKIHKLWS